MDDLSKENRDAKIELSNLRRIATVLGDNISDAELAVMIKGADMDGKGYVDRQDFYELMVAAAERVMQTTGDSEEDEVENQTELPECTGSQKMQRKTTSSIVPNRKT